MTAAPAPHILLVDDEAITVMALERFLGRKGFRVSVAADGHEALDRAATDPPDLMVTDMRMPRLSGGDLIRRIRATRPDLPVIVVTGYMGGDLGADLDTAGGGAQTTVMTKPMDPEALLAAIARMLMV